ncbi:MAG TPA: MFS transporter [Chloroflexota bacterium]|nr:MFS transporter [Chloroflexota bacterium]
MTDEAGFRRLGVLWLAGISLRITVLAIPPVIPAIHSDLALNEKAVGILTSLPLLLLAAAAMLGSLIIHRLGARRALIIGLWLVALAGAARGAGPTIPLLFAMTFAMGCGISVCQPALPSLVAQWFKRRIGLATASYSNGLLVGEMVAAGLMLPVVLPLVHGSWELGLAFWSTPVVITAVLVAVFTKHHQPAEARRSGQWWPDWQDRQTWRLGLLLGLGQIAYWVPNAFIADYLKTAGHPEYIAASLTSLNAAQIPASLLVAAFPGVLVQKRWPMMLDGALIAIAGAGLILGGPALAAVWAGLLGFAGAFIFVLNLALPPLLAAPEDVHRLSAGIFSISYTCAFLGPLVGGAIWDATGSPVTAFLPAIAGAAAMSWLAATVDLSRGRSYADGGPPGATVSDR